MIIYAHYMIYHSCVWFCVLSICFVFMSMKCVDTDGNHHIFSPYSGLYCNAVWTNSWWYFHVGLQLSDVCCTSLCCCTLKFWWQISLWIAENREPPGATQSATLMSGVHDIVCSRPKQSSTQYFIPWEGSVEWRFIVWDRLTFSFLASQITCQLVKSSHLALWAEEDPGFCLGKGTAMSWFQVNLSVLSETLTERLSPLQKTPATGELRTFMSGWC